MSSQAMGESLKAQVLANARKNQYETFTEGRRARFGKVFRYNAHIDARYVR